MARALFMGAVEVKGRSRISEKIGRKNTTQKILTTGIVILWIALYIYGAWVQARDQNTFMWGVDQRAYMAYARDLVRTDYAYAGDRNRMPLYPILQSFHYRDGMSNWRYFNEGQALNIALSVFLLIGLYLVLRKRLPRLMLLNFMLITTFTLFMFKAGYFQTELLFYFLFFCAFLMLSRLLVRPDPKLAALAGGTLALAHLSKASVMPALVLFLGLASLKFITGLYFDWRYKISCSDETQTSVDKFDEKPPQPARGVISQGKQVATIILVPLIFLIIVFPYLQHSKKVYGHYFYNVNSTFYFWAKNSHEAEYVEAHGDRVGWPMLPDDEIPSMRRYLREHGIPDIAGRFWEGLQRSERSHRLLDYGYLKFIGIFMGVSLVVVFFNRRMLWGMLNRDTLWVVLFRAGFLGGYFASYLWYAVINSGQRFMLSIFIPLMFTFAAFLSLPAFRQQKIRLRGREIIWFQAFSWGVLVILLLDLIFIFSGRISGVYGGR